MTPQQAQRLGSYMRERRRFHQLTTRALAGLAQVDHSTVARLEQGLISAPSPGKLRRIAKVLDIPVHELLSKAHYLEAADLPTPKPYLRAKYPDLPAAAIEDAERYLTNLMREHGVDAAGPEPGEDE